MKLYKYLFACTILFPCVVNAAFINIQDNSGIFHFAIGGVSSGSISYTDQSASARIFNNRLSSTRIYGDGRAEMWVSGFFDPFGPDVKSVFDMTFEVDTQSLFTLDSRIYTKDLAGNDTYLSLSEDGIILYSIDFNSLVRGSFNYNSMTGVFKPGHTYRLQLAATADGNGFSDEGTYDDWTFDLTTSLDVDSDGFYSNVDCNDTDASINPGATEVAGDGIDQDCNGFLDPWFDADVDGYNNINSDFTVLDCNDNEVSIYPGATEIANDGIDQDCDGVDLIDSSLFDIDLDGFMAANDCNDNDDSIYPGAMETKHDGVDQDCNGYDLTIDITDAVAKTKSGALSITATSSLGKDAELSVDGFGPMSYNKRKNQWTFSARKLNPLPTSVTVSGIEGSETVLTTAK